MAGRIIFICQFFYMSSLIKNGSAYLNTMSPSSCRPPRSATTELAVVPSSVNVHDSNSADKKSLVRNAIVSSFFLATVLVGGPVNADEFGVEVEAPTLFTGETTEICIKRGPLGACTKTAVRTPENDNDKAKAYFKDPSELIKQKEIVMRGSDSEEGNALIEKLKQRTEDNRERNELEVQQKTFDNDQSGTFGPFDRQVLILNTDGKTFTLLENPQAMRLKKAGFIGNKRAFIKQPTQEEIDGALEADGIGGIVGKVVGIFGGSD